SQPAISRTKLEGLVSHYGFTPATQATAYFEIHATRDNEHAAASAEVLLERPQEEADRLLAAAEAALRGNWHLLDGVNASHMTPPTAPSPAFAPTPRPSARSRLCARHVWVVPGAGGARGRPQIPVTKPPAVVLGRKSGRTDPFGSGVTPQRDRRCD